MFRLAIQLAFKPVGIYRYIPQIGYASRGFSTTLQKMRMTNPKRKSASSKVTIEEDTAPYKEAYSKVTREEAEERLGFFFDTFEGTGISVSHMLAEAGCQGDSLGKDEVQRVKEKVYDHIVEFLESEGYPTESTEDYKEANVNDLVFTIISPIIAAFRINTQRNVRLRREKQIAALDPETGGHEEFVTVDMIRVGHRKFVFLVEAKKSSIGEAKKQCLLALKDIGENNGGGVVYGFVTTGEHWQMIRYDGTDFTQTDGFQVLFHTMRQEKARWMKESSIVVDCIHAALRSGGCVIDN